MIAEPLVSSGAPTVPAVLGLLFGAVSCGLLVLDRFTGRGRHDQRIEGKVDALTEEVAEIKQAQGIADKHVHALGKNVEKLVQEWRGVDGTNGYRSILRGLVPRVEAIEIRNTRIDAVKAFEEKEMKKIGEHPKRMRDSVEGVGQDDN